MGKMGDFFLCFFAAVVCVSGSSVSQNPDSNTTKIEIEISQELETQMEELEKFHEEFNEFKSSLVDLTAAFLPFHQSLIVNESIEEIQAKFPVPQSITSCSVAMEILPAPRSTKQWICPFGNGNSTKVEVLCDFQVDGGGWTVIQKRSSGHRYEFRRKWNGYVAGFGSIDGNFWLGLENIHALTKTGDQELRIELEDFEGIKKYAKYSNFSISDASDFYRLSISGYSGDAGDPMTISTYETNNGMRFSTSDQDNDLWSTESCAKYRGSGGWWFNSCGASHLNGPYREEGETFSDGKNIHWWSWKRMESLAKTEMKIRKRKSEFK